MKLKIISVFLIAFMLLAPVLSACGGASGTTTTPGALDTQPKTETDPNSVWDLPVHNLQGHDFLFLVRTTSHKQLDTFEIAAEDVTGDKINDAVFKRNSILQEKYNCTVSEERTENILTTCREALLAGDYVWDVIYGGFHVMRSLSSSNLLVDLAQLDNIQLQKNWWDHNLAEEMTIHGHTFYAAGDGDTLDDRSAVIVFVNLDILEINRQPNPYEMVKSGNWTIQNMYEIGEACWEDADGDGIFSAKSNDIAAQISGNDVNWLYLVGCGFDLSERTSSGEYRLPATLSEDMLSCWQELKGLITSPHRDLIDNGANFRMQHAAYFVCDIAVALNWSNASHNFGIIPMPKRNAEQENYYCPFFSGWYSSFAIPTTVDKGTDYQAAGFESGSEMVAYFLNAFSYESTDTVKVAFYDEVMKKQSVRDAETVEMIDIALANKLYDPVAIYDFGGLRDVFRDVGGQGSVGDDLDFDNVVSKYRERLEAARKALTNYLDYIDVQEEDETI